MNSRKVSGDRGEAEVAKYLRRKGYTLLSSQWRCRFGELDLVAKSRRGHICFVEVKLRSQGAIALPREFVDKKSGNGCAAQELPIWPFMSWTILPALMLRRSMPLRMGRSALNTWKMPLNNLP